MSEEIAIRSIQHYLYCPHRWGLLEIDRAWVENVFVTRANLMHERVHNPQNNYVSRGKKTYTAVPVYNDLEEYNIYGIIDCLELTEDKQGVSIEGSSKKYKICIVEYKPTKPKNKDFKDEDCMQVFAQKICVDFIFGCDCDAAIYYGDVRKRYYLPIKQNLKKYDLKLQKVLNEMRNCLEKGEIPKICKGQKCSGCSMQDLCMPKIKKSWNLLNEITKIEEGQ